MGEILQVPCVRIRIYLGCGALEQLWLLGAGGLVLFLVLGVLQWGVYPRNDRSLKYENPYMHVPCCPQLTQPAGREKLKENFRHSPFSLREDLCKCVLAHIHVWAHIQGRAQNTLAAWADKSSWDFRFVFYRLCMSIRNIGSSVLQFGVYKGYAFVCNNT